MRYLAVKNFERFQHYRDRAPTWIKLYRSLLDDYAFMALPEAARSQLMLLWILASVYENLIPNDVAFLKRKLGVTSRLYLAPLMEAGFLYETERHASTESSTSASKPVARTEQSAPPHARGRAVAERREETYTAETETETQQTALHTAHAKPDVEIRVETPADPSPRAAIDRFLAAAPEGKRLGLRATVDMWRSGNQIPPAARGLTSEILSVALDEYAAESASGGFSFTRSHVWAFVENVMRRYATGATGLPPANGHRRSNTAVDRTVENSRKLFAHQPERP